MTRPVFARGIGTSPAGPPGPASTVPGPAGPVGDPGPQGLPGVNAVANDTATASYIASPTSATATALSASSAASTPARRDALTRKGRAAAALTVANAQRTYEQAAAYLENWAVAPGKWTVSAGGTMVVAGNQLRGVTGGTVHTVALNQAAGDFLAKVPIYYKTGGPDHDLLVGWTTATVGSAPSAAGANLIGVGFRKTSSGFSLVVCDAGTITPVSVQPDANATWWVTISRDGDQASVTLQNASGEAMFKVTKPLTSFVAQQVGILHTDTRADTTATGVGVMTLRTGHASHPFRVNEVASATDIATVINGQRVRIALPVGWDSRYPIPFLHYLHGIGGSEADPFAPQAFGTNMPTVTQGALARGYAVVSCDNGGVNEVGSGYTYLADVQAYLRKRFNVGATVVVSESFGTATAARAIAAGLVPDLCGWAMLYPVTNLAHVYADNPAIAAAVDAKYGSLAAAIAAGADPSSRPGFDYLGVPIRVYQPSGDVVVRPADSAAFAASIAPYVSEAATPASGTGGHGSPGAFQPVDVLDFFDRCTGRVDGPVAATVSAPPSRFEITQYGTSWGPLNTAARPLLDRDADGRVCMNGTGTGGGLGTALVIPAGSRPARHVRFKLSAGPGLVSGYIDPANGALILTAWLSGGDNTEVSFDNLSWSTV